MKIKYLGTAAYEGIPTIFCHCDICKKSLELGGKNIRTRAQAIINDELLLDFGPDTVQHFQRYQLDFNKIENCLVTHSHGDHLYVEDIEIASPHFSHYNKGITFFTGKSGTEKIEACMKNHDTYKYVKVNCVEAFETFEVAEKYEVTAFEANHEPTTSPLFYLVKEKETGKSVLYAHDTGIFSEKDFEKLKEFKNISLVSLDCTGGYGDKDGWRNGHMSIRTNLEVIARLKEIGCITSETKIIANHFSHNGKATYDDLSVYAEQFGIIVSYDGLELEF